MKKLLLAGLLISSMVFAEDIKVKVDAALGYKNYSSERLSSINPNISVSPYLEFKEITNNINLSVGAGLNVNYRTFSTKDYTEQDDKNFKTKNEELKDIAKHSSGLSLIPQLNLEVGTSIKNINVLIGANVGYGLHLNDLGSFIAGKNSGKDTVTQEINNKLLKNINPGLIYKGYLGTEFNNFNAKIGYGNLSGIEGSLGAKFEF